MAAYRRVYRSVTRRLTAEDRDQLQTLVSSMGLLLPSFDKHGLILIIFFFGRQHQHTFKNDVPIQLQFAKVGAFFETEGFCDPWTITAASCRLMLRIFTVISRSCLVTLEWEWVMVVVNSLQTLC